MPRPPKQDSALLSCVLPPVRCTQEEKDLIRKKADGLNMSLSAYLRQMALKGKITIPKSDLDFEAVNQLRKIGVNLNQLTKRFHATGLRPAELQSVQQKLESALEQILQKGGKP